MKKLACFTFLIIFGLAACNGAVQPITPTASASPKPTTTILAAYTIDIPTLTLAPTQTIYPTIDSSLMNSATQIALCNAGHWFESKTSPDGQWVATDCDDGNIFRLHIVRVDATKEWQVSFKDLTGSESFGTTNRFGEHVGFPSIPLPYHWYKDSRYLFIAPQVIADGNTSDGVGLYRFDTQTGRFSPFLPVGEASYNFAFAPNDEYYAYSYGMDEKYIHIVSLQTGKDQAIQLPGEKGSARSFLWSPDNLNFVFIYDDAITEKNALLLFDTSQKAYTTLLEAENFNFVPIHWESNLEVTIKENISQGQQYLLNINTKELQPISTQASP